MSNHQADPSSYNQFQQLESNLSAAQNTSVVPRFPPQLPEGSRFHHREDKWWWKCPPNLGNIWKNDEKCRGNIWKNMEKYWGMEKWCGNKWMDMYINRLMMMEMMMEMYSCCSTAIFNRSLDHPWSWSKSRVHHVENGTLARSRTE